MSATTLLADRFEEHRAHLKTVAYRLLGSLAEVDDAVQQTWLRLDRTDPDEIENLGGWLTMVISRICLDMLRSRGARPEERLDTHIPDPIVTGPGGPGPEDRVVLADSVGLAGHAASSSQRRRPTRHESPTTTGVTSRLVQPHRPAGNLVAAVDQSDGTADRHPTRRTVRS